jgi:hypothetical protein
MAKNESSLNFSFDRSSIFLENDTPFQNPWDAGLFIVKAAPSLPAARQRLAVVFRVHEDYASSCYELRF